MLFRFLMTLASPLIIVALAIAIEAASGYPQSLYRAIGHPVTWIGALISRLDTWLNREKYSFAHRHANGVFALIILLAVVGSFTLTIQTIALLLPYSVGVAVLAIFASTFIAQRCR